MMIIKKLKLITFPLCVIMILGIPYIKKYFKYRINIDDGLYRLYDDQNIECWEISILQKKENNQKIMTCEYSMNNKTEKIILEFIKTQQGYYYYCRKENSIYVVIKSLDEYYFDIIGEKIQNEFHLFCISKDDYNEIITRMKNEHIYFYDYFLPSLERTLSLHFGKTKIK